MSELTLWHNPRCSKSRQAKALLDERGVAYAERRYLDDPPTPEELDALLTALGREPWELARAKELRDLGLQGTPHDRAAWLGLLARHPVLVERPVLVAGDRAVVGRPPEAVLELLP